MFEVNMTVVSGSKYTVRNDLTPRGGKETLTMKKLFGSLFVLALVFSFVACDKETVVDQTTLVDINGPIPIFDCSAPLQCITHEDCQAEYGPVAFCRVLGQSENPCRSERTYCMNHCESTFEFDRFGYSKKTFDSCGTGFECNTSTHKCEEVTPVKPDADTVDSPDSTTDSDTDEPDQTYPNWGEVKCYWHPEEITAIKAALNVSKVYVAGSWVLPPNLVKNGRLFGYDWNKEIGSDGSASFYAAENTVLVGFNVDTTDRWMYEEASTTGWIGSRLQKPYRCTVHGEDVPVSDKLCWGRGWQIGNMLTKCDVSGY